MKNTGKCRHGFFCVMLSLILAFLFVAEIAVYASDEASVPKSPDGMHYLSEVKLFYGKSAEEAQKKCLDAGYLFGGDDLNYSNGGDKVYLGYKTTDRKEDAVTDLRYVEMDTGYQKQTYGQIAEKMVTKVDSTVKELSASVMELRDNHKSGIKTAVYAVKLLNCFYIPEKNISLGDFFLTAANADLDSYLKKIITRAEMRVSNVIFNALAAGVTEKDETWADRLAGSEIAEKITDSKWLKSNAGGYLDYAKELAPMLQTFAKYCEEAKAQVASGTTADTENITFDKDNNGGLGEFPDELNDEIMDGGEIDATQNATPYYAAYSLLSEYYYIAPAEGKSGETIADYLVRLGKKTYDTNDDFYEMFPFVDAITDGQVSGFKMCGVVSMASNIALIGDEDFETRMDSILDTINDEIGSASESEWVSGGKISVWHGINADLYDTVVAYSTDAINANTSGQVANLAAAGGTKKKVDNIVSKVFEVACFAWIAVATVVMITYQVIPFVIGTAMTVSLWAFSAAAIGTTVGATILGILGCSAVILNWVALVVFLVALVVMAIRKIVYACKKDEFDVLDYVPYVDTLFDYRNGSMMEYSLIKENGGSDADINGNYGMRWAVLYSTKDTNAGRPIVSENPDDIFKVSYSSATPETGYEAVNQLGNVTAANLNAVGKLKARGNVYLFVKKDSSPVNDGETVPADKYLTAVKIVSSETDTEARNTLTSGGYSLLDVDLTPGSKSEHHSYLGYKTSEDVNQAISDIRVMPGCSDSTVCFGNATYALAGTTANGDSVYYTAAKSAGSPITSEIQCSKNLMDKDCLDKGYEPVNMFCGGNAFDFNNTEKYDSWNKESRYLFFLPSETFTSGTKYLSGIVTVIGQSVDDNSHATDDYIEDLGLKKLSDYGLTDNIIPAFLASSSAGRVPEQFQNEGISHGGPKWLESDCSTYLCYSETYNRYRAIYGIETYTACTDDCVRLNSFLGSPGDLQNNDSVVGAYAVSSVCYSVRSDGGSKLKSLLRGTYSVSGYGNPIAGLKDRSGKAIASSEAWMKCLPEDYETVDWDLTVTARCKAVYVEGPTKNKRPLTLDDIFVTESADTLPDGFSWVQDAKTPYRTEPHNIAVKTISSGSTVYMACRDNFTNGFSLSECRYADNLYLASFDFEKDIKTIIEKTPKDDREKTRKTLQNELYPSSHDSTVARILSQATVTPIEIVMSNLASPYSESIAGRLVKHKESGYEMAIVRYKNYKLEGTQETQCTYLGLSRTSKETDALTGIVKLASDIGAVNPTVKINSTSYKRVSDIKISDGCESYYLYQSAGGGKPGVPVTFVSVSEEPIIKDCCTVLTADEMDREVSSTVNGKTKKTKVYATLKGSEESLNYIHLGTDDTSGCYIETVYVGHGKDRKSAMCNLLSLGCSAALDYNLNDLAGGEFVVLGISRLEKSSVKDPVTKEKVLKYDMKYAVKNIIVTIGEEHHFQMAVKRDTVSDGIMSIDVTGYDNLSASKFEKKTDIGTKYFCAVDDYSYGDDPAAGVSLNSGTYGKKLYVYYTYDGEKSGLYDATSPITKIAAVSRDGVMTSEDAEWEYIIDLNGNQVNMNEGAFVISKESDNRIYLFALREDKMANPAARITGGVSGLTEQVGALRYRKG